MIEMNSRKTVGFFLSLAGLGLGLNACSDSPASSPGAVPPGATPPASMPSGDPGMDAPPGTDPTPPPSSEPMGTGEVPAGTDAPLDNSGGGATGSDTGAGAGGAGAGGAPAMPSIVPIDCPEAAPVPIAVAWDDIADQDAAWYATPEALSLAENVLYYRNASGGWPKNIDMTTRATPLDDESTIDNDGTTTQIDYLARVYSATGCSRYGDAALGGIDYLLEAQYDNGGWPQIYPNATDYHTHITFNDNAMVHVLELLRSVSNKAAPYGFADDALAASAGSAVERGIGVILATQIVIDGVKTGWCAQHDEVTLAPAQARTYELPSLSGSEGANLMRFLMTIDNPSPEVREAVQAAAAWFESVALSGIRVEATVDATQVTGEDRVVVQDAAAPLLWARFYELGTDRPIFSSRCEVQECADDPFFMVRYSLAEIENERRVGYAWYGNWPRQLLATTYPEWRARWMP
ncbi:MAG TPA: pectate lyase [Polyangiaceae bacterium]|nr:pectate lyase [Polyangiaceae bacterium]